MSKETKKKIKKISTLKGKKAVGRRADTLRKVIENKGKSISGAMLEAGYSPSYAHNPQLLKKTRKWKEIMADKLSDEMVAGVHAELMVAQKLETGIFPLAMDDDMIRMILAKAGCNVIHINETVENKSVYYGVPDSMARKSAVDMAYKCKGIYAPEKFEEVNPLAKLSNAELAEKRKTLLKFLLKKK